MAETKTASQDRTNQEFVAGPDGDYQVRRLLQVEPLVLLVASINVDVRGYARIVFIPGASATLKYSVIDSLDATAHLMPAAPVASAGDDLAVSIDVEGNFYRLEVAVAASSLHFIA